MMAASSALGKTMKTDLDDDRIPHDTTLLLRPQAVQQDPLVMSTANTTTTSNTTLLMSFCIAALLSAFFYYSFPNEIHYQAIKVRISPLPLQASQISEAAVTTVDATPSTTYSSNSSISSISKSTSSYNLTFQELALQLNMPKRYQEMVESLSILDPHVKTCKVHHMRKIVLKFRDLLDVFEPIYPSAGDVKDADEDIWNSLRHHVSTGYSMIGDFLDYCHAHIRVKKKQVKKTRRKLLKWKANFEEWSSTTNVPAYLAAPATGSYRHDKTSHLFWRSVAHYPKGRDSATETLHRLGSLQLNQAITYLEQMYPSTNVMPVKVQEKYHNLRKEFRSILDEYELLGDVMFPTQQDITDNLALLATTRKLLGDLNDDWTAVQYYKTHNNMYPKEIKHRIERVQAAWNNFKTFAAQSDLEGALKAIAASMEETQPLYPPVVSLEYFLMKRKDEPTSSIVIGNEAGDADTVISAIALSYIESIFQDEDKTPIVSIPKEDLLVRRPDIKLLLKLAGLSRLKSTLLFINDDDKFMKHLIHANVTLVDHNRLESKFRGRKDWKVTEIVDHHHDTGYYLDTCNGTSRNIAFSDGKALVASACTLVAERLHEVCSSPYPTSVSLLLLGVILLDSVNLSEDVGKVTPRDIGAVDDLLKNTDWTELPPSTQSLLSMSKATPIPNSSVFFQVLQTSKYDPAFWKSLSIEDALKYDYKAFVYKDGIFGISTVLTSADVLYQRTHFAESIRYFIKTVEIQFLGIMFAYDDKESRHLRRQFGICAGEAASINGIADYLLTKTDLDLVENKNGDFRTQMGLSCRFFDQGNIKDSRKQIGPFIFKAVALQ